MPAYYTNPIVHDDFPDPTVLHVPGQGYFAYATHDIFSPTINNILVRRSADLVNWSPAEGALLEPPVWAQTCKKFWCPQVVFVKGEYRLYYAAEPDTKDGMCVAMARSAAPTGFVDCGFPVSRLPGSSYQMIDPCFFSDPVSGRDFLYYGSAHEPIAAVQLEADGITFRAEPVPVLYPGSERFHRLREGAFVTYHPTFKKYLLWVSGDNTWEANSYAISVYWSGSPLGPFEPVPGDQPIVLANSYWDAPGQNCVLTDAAGHDWIIYHAVDTHDRYISGTGIFKRKMCMDRVIYDAQGLPAIAGDSPSFGPQAAPVAAL